MGGDRLDPGGTARATASGVPGICLLALVGAACSIDASKLRGPVAAGDGATAHDEGTERPIEADLARAADADVGGDAGVVDTLAPPADLLGGDRFAGPDESGDVADQAGPDGRVADTSVPEDAFDLPPASDDGDSPSGDGGDPSGDSGDAGGAGGAAGSGGSGGTGGTGGAAADPDLVLWYKFDESSGSTAADSSGAGDGARDGALGTAGSGGSATFSTDCRVGTHALRLTPSSSGSNQAGGFVTTPSPTSLAPDAITIAFWVKLAEATSTQNWARLFDFGSGTGPTDPYLYMTARAGEGSSTNPRFGITEVGHDTGYMQRLDAPSPMTANVWHHVAVVLPAGAPYTGALYVDGLVVVTNDAMTVHPSDVGRTSQNWLGRSPYDADPFFSGWLDDFRIYKRALSATEIAVLMALR